MTEYDYSPEAYERYIKTQERISKWVSQTKAHERRYANPFVPTERTDSQSSSSSTSLSPHHRSKSNVSATYIVPNAPKRSKTLDSNKGRNDGNISPGGSSTRPSRSRSFTNTSIDTRSKPRSRSHGPSHSHGAYQVVTPPYPYPQAMPQRSYSTQHPHQQQHHHSSRPSQPANPIRSTSTPPAHYYNSRHAGPIQVPAPHSSEHYVIIPPHSSGDDRSSRTRRVELVSTKGNVPYPNAVPPPRKDSGGPFAKEPLLKRLLGSIIWNGGGGGGVHRRDTTGSQRRTRRRSTY